MLLFTLLVAIAAAEVRGVDFDTDVLPILTKKGCNAGACHGAAAGRGGFKLSLFAGDAAADHAAIALELEGRRINVASADKSLLLTKPLGIIDHEGGALLELGSPDAAVLERWIAEGAVRRADRRIVSLRVAPTEIFSKDLNHPVDVKVFANFQDGESRDVTKLTIFTPSDATALSIDESGRLKVLRSGSHWIAVRFLQQLATVQITVPIGNAAIRDSDFVANNWIDHAINHHLRLLGLSPTSRASDGLLLRRLQLDLTGRLPTTDELEQFVNSSDVNKFEKQVDQILSTPEFVDYWTYRIASQLHIQEYALRGDQVGANAYFGWLREQIAEDRGWDEIARRLITALGDSHRVGPANFHRQSADARSQAEMVGTVFLGAELRCANCHNHPLDRWTQADFHGLAAVFARMDRGQVVSLRNRGEVTNPATGSAIAPRFPGGGLATDADPRDSLAHWLTSTDNPYFARAFVNRVWKELMGRGLVEPTDAIHSTTPATHPELLERLAREFVANQYRLKPLVRQIVLSAAYQRGGKTGTTADDERFYAHAIRRPLTPEIYIDAIEDVCSSEQSSQQSRHRTRLIQRPDAMLGDARLAVLSGCARSAQNCSPAETVSTNLATQLAMINGHILNESIMAPSGFVATQVASGTSTDEIIRRMYLRALSRAPRQDEFGFWTRALSVDGRTEKFEDFVWSLLTCKEFKTNH